MVAHVVLIERILAHSVEQGDLLLFFLSEITDRVVSKRIITLHMVNQVLGHLDLVPWQVLNLVFIIEPIRSLRVKRLDDVSMPVKVRLVMVVLRRNWLLKSMLTHIPMLCDFCLR